MTQKVLIRLLNERVVTEYKYDTEFVGEGGEMVELAICFENGRLTDASYYPFPESESELWRLNGAISQRIEEIEEGFAKIPGKTLEERLVMAERELGFLRAEYIEWVSAGTDIVNLLNDHKELFGLPEEASTRIDLLKAAGVVLRKEIEAMAFFANLPPYDWNLHFQLLQKK